MKHWQKEYYKGYELVVKRATETGINYYGKVYKSGRIVSWIHNTGNTIDEVIEKLQKSVDTI